MLDTSVFSGLTHHSGTLARAVGVGTPSTWTAGFARGEEPDVAEFSGWHRPHEEANESAETVIEGEMPPWYYVVLHPPAKLSPDEKNDLVRGLTATFGSAGQEKVDD